VIYLLAKVLVISYRRCRTSSTTEGLADRALSSALMAAPVRWSAPPERVAQQPRGCRRGLAALAVGHGFGRNDPVAVRRRRSLSASRAHQTRSTARGDDGGAHRTRRSYLAAGRAARIGKARDAVSDVIVRRPMLAAGRDGARPSGDWCLALLTSRVWPGVGPAKSQPGKR
jgi:hypothetical protein